MAEARKWQQGRVSRWVWTGLAALAAVCVGSVPVAAAAAAQSAARAGWAALAIATFGSLAAILLRTSWRTWHARVEISSSAVTVVGPIRTHVVPIETADHFAAQNRGGKQPAIVLVLVQGRPVWLWIFNRNGLIWQFKRLLADLEPNVEELNQALQAARAGMASAT